jgi:WD40 repeat protein
MNRLTTSIILLILLSNCCLAIKKIDSNLTNVFDIAFSKDGALLACTNGNKINLYDTKTWQLEYVYENIHKGNVLSVTFSSDNLSIASCGIDSSVVIWKITDNKSGRILGKSKSILTCVRFTLDNNFVVSGCSNGEILIWDVNSLILFKTLNFHSQDITTIDISNDGKYLSCGSGDQIISFWNTQDWTLIEHLDLHSSWVRYVTFSPKSNYLVSVGDNSEMFFFNYSNTKMIFKYGEFKPGFHDWVMCADYNTDGDMVVTATNSGKIFLLNSLQNYSYKLKYQINKVKFQPNSYTMAIATQMQGVFVIETNEMKSIENKTCEFVLTK